MNWYVSLAVLQLGLVLAPAARAVGDDLPADAKKEIDQFRGEAALIAVDANAKIAAKKEDLIKRLRILQTKYTKEGKLDEAVAIRDQVRILEGAVPVRPKFQARPPVSYRACQRVEVEWGGKWWAAEVLAVRGNQYYIHYTGWADSWNEWVTDCRIRACAPCVVPHRR
jgi:hypothetical protein